MNRRQSLRALAVSSIGAATPFSGWASRPGEDAGSIADAVAGAGNSPAGRIKKQDSYGDIFLIAEKDVINAIGSKAPKPIKLIEKSTLDAQGIVEALAKGAFMIWIGNADNIPKELSIGSFDISQDELNIKPAQTTPLTVNGIKLSGAAVQSGFILPPKEMPLHNIDEEVRADFLPIFEAYDRFGNLVGFPGVLMSYYAPSLAAGRFKGSECFFFFINEPLKMLDANGWQHIFEKIDERNKSRLQVKNFNTNYASYKPGERIQINTAIQNRGKKAVASTLRFYIQSPDAKEFSPLTEMRRVAEGNSDTQAVCDFLASSRTKGLWKIKLEIWQDVDNAEKLAYTKGELKLIDSREIGFMVLAEELFTPQMFRFEGPEIIIDNKKGFWSGTHYYPSTSWWEWVWRDFRPLKAAEDFAAIRKAGYRIVRIWIDPVIDEPVLRAMDAAIQLASDYGIVLDICIFTQWVRYMGFERNSGEQVTFEFRNPEDFNIVSFSLRNLNLQREYMQVIGSRWKNAGNIFYNIANEVFVNNPDNSQVDAEVLSWPENKLPAGARRDTMLFNRWSGEMTKALRKVGANQPAMPGYMFSTMNGGDVYLGNKDAPIVPWHSYLPTDQTALTIQYFDPISSNRPLLLEEFGRLGWNNIKNYDENVHYALAAGAAAAMSYEWGVSWLSRESCYTPIPLLEAGVENPDPRWFPPYLTLNKTWPENGVGMCATPSGTGYGSIYHGTPFPAEAAVALGRLGLMGEGLQRVVFPEKVFVIIPQTKTDALEAVENTFKALWKQKAIFGVWQEADLASLPNGTKAIICPVSLSSGLPAIKSRGIKVFEGADAWKSCDELEKVSVDKPGNINLLSRRTSKGILFTLVHTGNKENISVQYKAEKVNIGIEDFALVHYTNNGIALLEGTGDFIINNTKFCSIDKGRLIVSSSNETGLLATSRLKLIVTGPAKLSFRKNIASVAISDGLQQEPRVVKYKGSGRELDIDDQLSKYVIHVSLK